MSHNENQQLLSIPLLNDDDEDIGDNGHNAERVPPNTQQTVKDLLDTFRRERRAEHLSEIRQIRDNLPEQPKQLSPTSATTFASTSVVAAAATPYRVSRSAVSCPSPTTPSPSSSATASGSGNKLRGTFKLISYQQASANAAELKRNSPQQQPQQVSPISSTSPGFTTAVGNSPRVSTPSSVSPRASVNITTTNSSPSSSAVLFKGSQPIPSDASTVFVSNRQKGNPILQHVSNIKLEYRGDLLPDYIMSEHICAFYIACDYHLKNPQYLWTRMEQLGSMFKLRVILCHINTEEHEKAVMDITKLCMAADYTLILCFSTFEVARYIETYKLYENKSARTIQVKIDDQFMPRLTDAITSVRSVNKTDAATLINNFGTLQNVMGSSIEELSILPGFGEKKVKRFYEILHAPFIPGSAKKSSKPSPGTKKQTSILSFSQPLSGSLQEDSNPYGDEE